MEGLAMAMISQKVERQVVLLDENRSAYEAALLMREKHIGSVVVTRASKVVGLFTERDLIFRVIGEHGDPREITIRDAMRTDVPRGAPAGAREEGRELWRRAG